MPGSSERGDWFGGEVSLGDINGDGYQDLVVGASGENIDGIVDVGSVTVMYGSAQGINTASGAQFFIQGDSGVPGYRNQHDYFGSEVKLTDVTGDGRADLTVGSVGEGGGGPDHCGNGSLTYLPSNGTKITTTGARGISATAVGVNTDGYPMFGANAAN
nr:FG-GAP repeat protein [Streptomyces sp. NBC_01280]